MLAGVIILTTRERSAHIPGVLDLCSGTNIFRRPFIMRLLARWLVVIACDIKLALQYRLSCTRIEWFAQHARSSCIHTIHVLYRAPGKTTIRATALSIELAK